MTSTTARPPALFALIQAAGCVTSFVESRLADVGLSIPKLAALQRLVDAGDSLPLGQLACRLSCVKSNVTQLIDRLEADGFVSRELDAEDKRSRLAVITPAGRKAWEEGSRIQNEAEQHLFAQLSIDEVATLSEIIDKLKPKTSSAQSS